MQKVSIDEQTLNRLIMECIQEEMEDEGAIGDWFRKQRQKIKDSGGFLNYAMGGLGYGAKSISNFFNRAKQAYKAGKNVANAEALKKRHPMEYFRDRYGEDLDPVLGSDAVGRPKYPRAQFIKALRAYGNSPEQINQILIQQGYAPLSGDEGGGSRPADPNAPEANPDAVRNSKSSVSESSMNELGNTKRGQEQLGRLQARREKEANKACRFGSYDEMAKKMRASELAYTTAENERKKSKDKDKLEKAFRTGQKKK